MTSLNLEPIRIVRCFDILIMLQNILNAILKHPKIRLKIFCKLLKRNLKLIIGQHSMSNWLCTLTDFRRKWTTWVTIFKALMKGIEGFKPKDLLISNPNQWRFCFSIRNFEWVCVLCMDHSFTQLNEWVTLQKRNFNKWCIVNCAKIPITILHTTWSHFSGYKGNKIAKYRKRTSK